MNLRARLGPLYRSVKYTGTAVRCPICRGRFSRFIRYNTRDDAQCPRCLSLERHRTMWLHLERSGILASATTRVLDVAPRSAMSRRLQHRLGARYVSGDLVLPPVTVYLDLTQLPFRPASFDAVICSHVLEHIPDDAAAMRELCRVLRPGGFALVPVPIHPTNEEILEDPSATTDEARLRLFGQADHVRFYSRRGFEERLRAAGLMPGLVPVEGEPAELNLDPDVYVAVPA